MREEYAFSQRRACRLMTVAGCTCIVSRSPVLHEALCSEPCSRISVNERGRAWLTNCRFAPARGATFKAHAPCRELVH